MQMIDKWEDVTIGMYQELNDVQSENEISKVIERIAILSDSDPKSIRELPIKEFQSLTENIGWVLEKPKTNEVRTRFELDGKKYGIIPDLNFISTGEWADIENWKEDTILNLHLICALIYRPVTKEDGDVYEIEPHKPEGFMSRAELFKNNLSIEIVYEALFFFSSSGIKFVEIIADYLEMEADKVNPNWRNMMKTTQKASKKSN